MQTSESTSQTDNAPPLPPPEIILTHVESEISHERIEVATAVDAVEPVPAVQMAAAEVQATTTVQFNSKPTEEVAAIRIQKAFRGYLVCFATFIETNVTYFILLFLFSASLLPISVECFIGWIIGQCLIYLQM